MIFNRLLFLLGLFFACIQLLGQPADHPAYFVQGGLVIKENGIAFSQSMAGGLNSPQFYKIDVNNDGVMDLICYDRNDGKLLPFIRTKDSIFTYAPLHEKYFPKGHFFYKTADLNSDGKMDIFTLDETSNLIIHKNITAATDSFVRFEDLGPQYYRNQYVPPFPILYNAFSLSKNDMPDISDIDGDGDLDIVTYDPFYTIYVLYKDVRSEFSWPSDTFEFQKMDVCFGYFNDFNSAITLGSCPYKEKYKPRHSGGATCTLLDLDEDGDMEMLLSNIGQNGVWMIKNGKKEYAHDYDTMIAWDSIYPKNTVRATTYEFPGTYYFDVDGDGIKDLITAPNGFSDVKETSQIWYYRNFGKNNKPDFRFVKNNWIAGDMVDLGAASVPAFFDIDFDGDQDMFIASNGDFGITTGVADRIAFYENTGTAKAPVFELRNKDFLNVSARGISDLNICFGDVDGDLDIDLVFGDRIGNVRWYENTAGPVSPAVFVYRDSFLIRASMVAGESNTAPAVFDYNGDNLPDLLVGMYNGSVALYANSGSIGNPKYTKISSNAWGMKGNEWKTNVQPQGFLSYGYAVPRVTDLDHDGIKEILIGTAYGATRLYRPNGRPVHDSLSADDGWLWQRSLTDSLIPDMGSRISPVAVDLTGDSIPELVFGNSRGGLLMATTSFTRLTSIPKIDYSKVQFGLFPNPAKDFVTLKRDHTTEDWTIRILDINGRLMRSGIILKHEKELGLSVGTLSPGMYLFEVNAKGSRNVVKFLIQHN